MGEPTPEASLRNVRDYFAHLVAGLRCHPEAMANVQDTLDAIQEEFAALAKARGETPSTLNLEGERG